MNKKSTKRRSAKRRSRKKQNKRQYRIRNWPEYNQALKQRGSLTVWLEPEALEDWGQTEPTGRRGASPVYSDAVILLALTLQVVYHQPLRGTQGLLASILQLMGLGHLPVPDYSTLCRRRKTLTVALPRSGRHPGRKEGLHLVVDSTGCKIYGEGEWKVRLYGWSQRRTWVKLHLGVDESCGEILAAALTKNSVGDSATLPQLLEQIEEPIDTFCGDGSYDTRGCYEALQQREDNQKQPIQIVIPPRRNARIRCGPKRAKHPNPLEARNETLEWIKWVGRESWKKDSSYHRRSLAETAMFRFKTIFGETLQARLLESQTTEALVRCRALNTMSALGKPQSYVV